MGPAPGPDSLIAQLREDLAARRIRHGLELLENCATALDRLDPAVPGAGVLLGVVAQWVDASYSGVHLVQDLLTCFPSATRRALSLIDYAYVRLADGMVAMAGENFEDANRHFLFVQSLEGEAADSDALAISNFWMARCLRRIGRYDDALSYTLKAKTLALDSGCIGMAAVMQVLESWLAFQKGRLNDASQLLDQASDVLAATDDFVTRGNIQSAYGRIARRQGRYEQALEYFERSVSEYRGHDPQHLHIARSLLNTAIVERLIALRCQRDIDRQSARRAVSADFRARRAEMERLRASARAHLNEALELYKRHAVHHGIGSVYITSGLLHLDGGDLERATQEASLAFAQGQEKRDYIVMSRVRLLQCNIENARLEEQIGDDPARHAQSAAEFARDAIELARQTQNRRLLARAYVWQGLTWANDHFQNHEVARRCLDEARALLKPDGHEWEDFQALQAKLMTTREIDAVLREWSEGVTGNKTFQQITDEFAAVIIPKVWEREGRKISRVASVLSISPKKVRRILKAAGLLTRE